jgi:hypothetical protein
LERLASTFDDREHIVDDLVIVDASRVLDPCCVGADRFEHDDLLGIAADDDIRVCRVDAEVRFGVDARCVSVRVVELDRRQLSHLVPGEAELHAVVYVGDRTDRNGDLFLAPEVSLVEQDMGDVMIRRVDDQPLDPPDVAVRCVDALAAAHLNVAHRNAIANDHLRTGGHVA